MSNEAAWIKQKQAELEVGPAERYEPQENELLVKVEVIAFSPIDAKTQRFAVHPIPYPNILGTSYAGTIEAVGPNVQSFSVGDRVVTLRSGATLADPRFGAFQKFALATPSSTSKLPPSVSQTAAATTLLNLAAAASALSLHLNLSPPPLSAPPTPKEQHILIYGGSSSLGGLATKYAAAAGYPVVTTSSPAHRDYVAALGPATVLDHTLPPADLQQQLASHGPYAAIFDAIGLPPVTNTLFAYLGSLPGGGAYNTVIPPLGGENPAPPGVERRFAPYSFAFAEPANAGFARWFFDEYVPQGLETGLVVPTRAEVVEGGLGGVQRALDLMHRGEVSGRKLVLFPWGESEGV